MLTEINISGNRVTDEMVILRELPFKIGDTLDTALLGELSKKAVQNLTNTSLFNFTDVLFIPAGPSEVVCEINLDERWYIWPGLVFSLAETNINSWWQNKDFERLNYGFYVQHFNFRGRREKLTLNFQHGWKRKVGLNYQVPGLNRSRTLGAGIEVFYANNREINYASYDNERQFFKTTRFIQEEFAVNGKIEYRPRFFNTHRFIAGVQTVIIDDTVTALTTDYLPESNTRSEYIFLSYGFKREMRDNRAYPLRGYTIDGSLDQEGLGILNRDDIRLTSLVMTVNSHHHLGGRWFFGHGLKGKTTLLGKPPYYFQRGLGYSKTFVRGYELNVIDGQHFVLYKSNLKFQLLRKKVIDMKLGFLKSFDKFHYSVFLNAFGDAGYVADNINAAINPLANSWQYGYGLGLDLVTYYDIVIRFEGSINKQGRPAFYIHFTNPI